MVNFRNSYSRDAPHSSCISCTFSVVRPNDNFFQIRSVILTHVAHSKATENYLCYNFCRSKFIILGEEITTIIINNIDIMTAIY